MSNPQYGLPNDGAISVDFVLDEPKILEAIDPEKLRQLLEPVREYLGDCICDVFGQAGLSTFTIESKGEVLIFKLGYTTEDLILKD